MNYNFENAMFRKGDVLYPQVKCQLVKVESSAWHILSTGLSSVKIRCIQLVPDELENVVWASLGDGTSVRPLLCVVEDNIQWFSKISVNFDISKTDGTINGHPKYAGSCRG